MNPREALAELPDDPDAIADVMRGYGIKGRQRDPDECVLARYLRDAVGEPVLCGFSFASYGFRQPAVIPENVSAFVERFDDGAYPDLIEDAA